MKTLKQKLKEKDLGVFLYDLRYKKGWTIEEFVERANMQTITIKGVRKWEHDLEFPELDEIYKISDLYDIPAEIIMQVRTNTLEEGLKGVHKELIRFISYILGFSIYGMIIITWIIIFVAGIWSMLLWADIANRMTKWLT